jgi:PHD/YefM family antitoxin component YafN of YafNO toxin-antitoxin module
MNSVITATEAKKNIYKLIDEISKSHIPVIIKGKKNNAVLINEEDWRAIEESLYIHSVPGLAESIIEEMQKPDEEFLEKIEW